MLRTEADVIRTLATGTYSIDQLYAQAEAAGGADRDDGAAVIHGRSDQRYKRRVRGALQHMKRSGRAQPMGDGMWYIEGTADKPRRALLLLLDGEPSEIELVLGDAAEILRRADEPIDLIVADPPYALDRGGAGDPTKRVYARNGDMVVDGYQDVPAGEYTEFTHRWIEAAAGALRENGGYLAVITGPQQAAWVQVAAEEVGLTYVNQVVAKRVFSLRTTRRLSHAHFVITLMCTGPLDSAHRYYVCPDDLPKAQSGAAYGLDWWDDIPKYERRGLVKYDNALPPKLVRRVVEATTPGEWQALVADPFLGSGTTAKVCLEGRRRFYGGDVNTESLRFTMARLLAERQAPSLLPA